MPLIDRSGVVTDRWTRVAADEPLPVRNRIIVDASRYADHTVQPAGQPAGVDIGQSLKDGLAAIGNATPPDLISIAFDAMGDGRGFSVAKALRDAGYQGRLRAHGPLIADQFAFALASGFDEIETTEDIARRQPGPHWRAASVAYSTAYQPSRVQNVLEQRRQRRDRREIHAWAI